MEWIALAATEMTQAQVIGWAAGIATAVATVVTAALTFWFRLIDRPSAQWEIIPQNQHWNMERRSDLRLPNHRMVISNVGTGAARLVSFIGVYCDVRAARNDDGLSREISLAEAGHSVTLFCHTAPSQWEQAGLLVTWTEPSHWFYGRQHKCVFFPFGRYFDRPVLQQVKFDRYGEMISKDVAEPDSEIRKRIQELERKLVNKENVVLASSNWCERRRQFRKLKKAGWGWPRVLPKINPEAADQIHP